MLIPKITYQEKYKSKACMVKQDCLPILRHIPKRFIVKSCEIKSSGIFDDGTEFQDIRVIVKEGVIE